MERRRLGTQGLEVSAEGLGCMGMSAFYGSTDEREGPGTLQGVRQRHPGTRLGLPGHFEGGDGFRKFAEIAESSTQIDQGESILRTKLCCLFELIFRGFKLLPFEK